MAEVRPFAGIRYRLGRAEDAADRICPPYDVISPAQQDALLAQDPHNVIRLELPKDEAGDTETANRYSRASSTFIQWLDEGVLATDPVASFYVYGQRYVVNGREQERLGLIGALKVEPYESGIVLPHEQTFPKHKEDRFRLLSGARAQFSPIFALYSAPEHKVREALVRITTSEPAASATDAEGVLHRLWPVADPGFVDWIRQVFEGRPVFIADGHHRYETAMRYRAERRAETPDAPLAPYDYVMTFLVEMDDPGLVLLPTHRLIRTLPVTDPLAVLSEHFTVEPVELAQVDQLHHHQIGLIVAGGSAFRLRLKDALVLDRYDTEHSPAWRDLDVSVLHRLVFEEVLRLGSDAEIVYTRDPSEARARTVSGEFAAAFLLPHPKVQELKDVAGARDKMPQKSTYFWPKAVTGLVIYGV